MNETNLPGPLVLSIYINARGFGYALFEGILEPVDWGMKAAQSKDIPGCLEKVQVLLHLLRPSVIVLQGCQGKLSRCSKRVEKLADQIATMAKEKRIRVFRYSRADLKECFACYGACTKDEIARAIARLLPEFAPRVPPVRKLWMSEDHRMGLFDALALVFAYYASEHLRPRP